MDITKLAISSGLDARVVDIAIRISAIIWAIGYIASFITHLDYLFATLSVDDSHDLYRPILNRVSQKLESSRTQRLARKSSYEIPYGRAWFFWNNNFIIVERHVEAFTLHGREEKETITLKTPGYSIKPLHQFISSVAASNGTSEMGIEIFRLNHKIMRHYRTWRERDLRVGRSIESVALDELVKQEVVKEIEAFLSPNHAQICAKHGIPWRRGYLFHGPPGTGKTSLVKALATHLNLRLYIVTLRDAELDDTELLNVFATFESRSIVLIEEIDRIFVTRKQDEEGTRIQPTDVRFSLSGLLSSMDGITSPEGYVLIATTNKPEKLDKALIRSGRIDRKVKFELITRVLAMKMFANRYHGERPNIDAMSEEFGDCIPDGVISAADVQGFMYATDPKGAILRASKHFEMDS